MDQELRDRDDARAENGFWRSRRRGTGGRRDGKDERGADRGGEREQAHEAREANRSA
jgi:hypothetical protein